MYEVKKLDLTNARVDDEQIVKAGQRIAEIVVLDMAAGASFQIRVGSNSDMITISRPFTMEPTSDQEANNGLAVRNAAQPGVIVEMLIAYGGAQLNTILT